MEGRRPREESSGGKTTSYKNREAVPARVVTMGVGHKESLAFGIIRCIKVKKGDVNHNELSVGLLVGGLGMLRKALLKKSKGSAALEQPRIPTAKDYVTGRGTEKEN